MHRLRCFKSHTWGIGILLVIFSVDLSAQDPPAMPALTTSGFVDVYFSKNFGKPAGNANSYRNFDLVQNRFDVSLAEIVFQRTASPIGFRVDADFGSANDLVHGSSQSSLAMLQQAYVTAILPVGAGLTVDAGKFVTHLGYEVIESRDNWNYSRSFLFAWAIPYYHFGVRAAYPVLPELTFAGHISNGWNNLEDNNDAKTVGASFSFTPSDRVTLTAGWIGGKEQADSSNAGMRNVIDVTLIYRPTPGLSFAINGDYGTESLPGRSVSWKGVALYGRYAFTAMRLGELTATFEHLLLGGLLLRAEIRHDWSTVTVYEQSDGGAPMDHQSTIALGAVVSF
jgi:hypothetical protein